MSSGGNPRVGHFNPPTGGKGFSSSQGVALLPNEDGNPQMLVHVGWQRQHWNLRHGHRRACSQRSFVHWSGRALANRAGSPLQREPALSTSTGEKSHIPAQCCPVKLCRPGRIIDLGICPGYQCSSPGETVAFRGYQSGSPGSTFSAAAGWPAGRGVSVSRPWHRPALRGATAHRRCQRGIRGAGPAPLANTSGPSMSATFSARRRVHVALPDVTGGARSG